MATTRIDKIISALDTRLRGIALNHTEKRRSPSNGLTQDPLTPAERRLSAGLMRVNHSGEICAQALYKGQSSLARNEGVRAMLLASAEEEYDHLSWCEQRLHELHANPSQLNSLWYGLSFLLGVLASAAGDKISLGFIAATEEQVGKHLENCLTRLPKSDTRSRVILEKMLKEEQAHGDKALDLGATELPAGIKNGMTQIARLMTKSSYYI